MIDLYSDRWEFAMSQNPDFEETSLFDLFPAEEKKTDKKEQPYFIFGLFLVLLWSIRFAVEFVKESQGGFESSLGLLSTGQWLSIPFILAGFYLLFRNRIETRKY